MVQLVVTFHRSIPLGSYGDLKSEVVHDFSRKVGFFWKNDPLRENFQNFVPVGFTDSRIHVLCENFVKFGRPEVGEIAHCLPDQKNSARSLALASAPIAFKICQDQQQAMYSECLKFHPNRFTFGGVIAERVNTVQTRHIVLPILCEAIASRRVIHRVK